MAHTKANPAGEGGAADLLRDNWPVPNSRKSPQNQPAQTRYVLTIVPTAECEDPICSLRWVLKTLLRRHKLKATSLEEVRQ